MKHTPVQPRFETVRDLFRSPKRWTKHVLASDKDYNEVGPRSKEAQSWCLLGAIEHVYRGRAKHAAIQGLRDTIHEEFGFSDICMFNDSPNIFIKDIRKAVRKAGI